MKTAPRLVIEHVFAVRAKCGGAPFKEPHRRTK